MCRDHGAVQLARGGAIAEFERTAAKRLGGANQAEAGLVVESGDACRQHAAVAGDDEDGFSLEQQVTNGQDEPGVIDDDTRALALSAQGFCRACLLRHTDAELDDSGGEIVFGDCAHRRKIRRSPRGPGGGHE